MEGGKREGEVLLEVKALKGGEVLKGVEVLKGGEKL